MTAQHWLDSERDYEAGRLLYQQLGDNERLKQVLSHGPSHYNQEALVWELGKLARAGVATAVILAPATPGPAAPAPEPLPCVPPLPSTAAALLVELQQGRRPLYDERTVLHQALEGEPSDADRLAVARRILQLSRDLNANWQTDAYVRAHGQRPPGPAPAPGLDTLPPAELLKKRNNLRSQRTKLRKRPDRAEDLARVEAMLHQVEQLLK